MKIPKCMDSSSYSLCVGREVQLITVFWTVQSVLWDFHLLSKGGKTKGLTFPVASVKISKWKQSCRSAQKMTVIFGIFCSTCVFLNIAILFACSCVHKVKLKSVPSEHLYLLNAMITECTMTFKDRFIFKY